MGSTARICRIVTTGVLLIAAIAGFGRRLYGQPSGSPSASDIAKLLLSDDPRQVAWGAHYAITSHDVALDGDLLTVAANWQTLPQLQPSDPLRSVHLTDEQLDRRDAMAAVLDALIQKNIRVSADSIRLLAPDFENCAAILLARLPLDQSQNLALDLYRHTAYPGGYTLQYVAAALLAQNPPASYAADLISGIHVRATVFVIPSGSSDRYGTGFGGDSAGWTIEAPRKDWPIFGIYSLSRQNGRSEFPVLSSPDLLYALRTLATNHYPGYGRGIGLGPADRLRFVAFMLGVQPDSIEWQISLTKNMQFNSDFQFESDLRFFIDSLEEQYRATADALEEKGLITAEEEPDARPQLDIHWEDNRGPGQPPLRMPSALPPHIRLIEGF